MRLKIQTLLLALLLGSASSHAQEFSRIVLSCPPGHSLANWKLVVQARAELVYGSAAVTVLSPHRLEVWLPNLPAREKRILPYLQATNLYIKQADGTEEILIASQLRSEWDAGGIPVFRLEFKGEQKAKLERITTKNLNQVIELTFGRSTKISPTVLEPITDGRVVITAPRVQANALRHLFGINDSRMPPTIIESVRRTWPLV